MASRGRQTFNKRQKEQQRKEKQQEKFARRQQRKVEKQHAADTPPEQAGQDVAEEQDFTTEPDSTAGLT